MANEKDTTTSQSSPADDLKKKKKAKPKGPIRWEAILPFCIFVALVWAYFFFFFDSHLRRGLEFVGTHANGAEVNIEGFKTSFWKASLDIRNIEVTDVEQPTQNKVQIETVRWQVLWDALLRGKVAIADASILNIGIGTPRKRPGRILPKDPPSEGQSKFREQALDLAQKQFEGNVLGDVAAMLDGTDPKEQLKSIQASLASEARIKILQEELGKKEKEWKERLDRLPEAKELKGYEQRLKNAKIDDIKNPAEAQAAVKEIDGILKEIDAKVKDVQATSKAMGTDVNTYENTFKELEELVKKDIQDLESRLQIPKLDVKNLAANFLGPMFLGKVRQAQHYMAKAREYMPPKKTADEKKQFEPPKPRERIAGRNYKFGRPHSYPLFWLQKAEISSKASSAEWSGNLDGKLENLTDDPPTIGKPTVLTFNGDFPKQQMTGVFGEVHIDHTTEKPLERLTLRVADFRVKGQQLVQSGDVQLAFADARARSEFKVELQEENVSINSNSVLSNVQYNIGAKKPLVAEILQNILKSVTQVTADAGVKGTWSNLDFSFETNLGREIQKGFEKELQARIAEARAKIRAFIDEKIGGEKAKLTAEFKKIEARIKGQLAEKQGEIDKAKADIEAAKGKALKGNQKKLETEGKKQLENLLKGKKLKF